MKMNLSFATYVDEIEFEPFLGKNEKKYQKAFEKWYYVVAEENLDGKKVKYLKPRKEYESVSLDVDVILAWIKAVAPDANPKLVRKNLKPNQADRKLPTMYF